LNRAANAVAAGRVGTVAGRAGNDGRVEAEDMKVLIRDMVSQCCCNYWQVRRPTTVQQFCRNVIAMYAYTVPSKKQLQAYFVRN